MRTSSLHRAAASAASLLCACAVPAPAGNSIAATVGPGGGRVDLPGSASLIIPGGAIARDVTMGVAVVTPPRETPAPRASGVVEFTPHGTRFATPVTIRLKYGGNAPSSRLTVLRLADPGAQEWQPVGGVVWQGGEAAFTTLTFSFYAVVEGFECVSPAPAACTSGCECCGTGTCVDIASDPLHCGACGNACGPDSYCASGGRCVALQTTDLCANAALVAISGELPASIVEVSPEQTADDGSRRAIAGAIAAQCGLAPVFANQSQPGLLDPCTDAPLLAGGNTILLVGGPFAQRLARYLGRSLSPATLRCDDATGRCTFTSRAGTSLAEFADDRLSPAHDYFLVSLTADPRGALILHVYGVGWEGTPAATWYVQQVLLPEFASGARSWQRYLVVEWTDDGDGRKGAEDTFTVLARDVP